ncbi:MAG: hypothetical protein ACF8XB_24745, partial [Planctomycetota bacterium JB042]
NYGSFDVVDKSVSIVGDLNGNVRVASSRVRNLTAEKRVLLSGLRFVRLHADDLTRPSLELAHNDGLVFLERILTLAPEDQAALFSAGLRVDDCDGVTVVDSLLFGSRGFQGFVGPGPFLYRHEAVAARDATLALWDTFLLGGRGAKGSFNLFLPDTFLPPTRGGHGLAQEGGFTFVSGGSITGGQGGDGDLSLVHLSCLSGEEGGDGIHLDAHGEVRLLDVQPEGGVGGIKGGDLCVHGPPGEPLGVVSGQVATIPGEATRLVADSPLREGQNAILVLEGPPGAPALLALSLGVDHLHLAAAAGTLATPPGALFVPFGPLDPQGFAVATVGVPELGVGVLGVVVTAQGVVAGPGGGVRLTAPTRIVALDASL